MSESIKVYTDGACSGNPGPGGWSFLYFAQNQVIEKGGGGQDSTTNNRMEIMALIEAIQWHQKQNPKSPLAVYSDSTLLINACTKWLFNWKRNAWVKSDGEKVLNQDLWMILDPLLEKQKLHFHHVRGHSGDLYNDRVDQIAVAYSKKIEPNLYSGPEDEYENFLKSEKEKESSAVPLKKNNNGDSSQIKNSKVQAGAEPQQYPVYVVLHEGSLAFFYNWSECEAAVKGVSGVKFKKVKNKNELELFIQARSK